MANQFSAKNDKKEKEMTGINREGRETNLTLKIDTTFLTPAQLRNIKTLNALILDAITSDQEDEYFSGSAEMMRICGALIKDAAFPTEQKGKSKIPYAEQALEYAVETLQEFMTDSKVIPYDH